MASVREIVESGPEEAQDALIRWAASQFASENVAFLFAVRHYLLLATRQRQFTRFFGTCLEAGGFIPRQYWGSCATMGRWIFDTFVRAGSPQEINISSSERQTLTVLANGHGSPFTPGDFTPAFNTIATMLNSQYHAASTSSSNSSSLTSSSSSPK